MTESRRSVPPETTAERVRRALERRRLVNLTGPLGSGKSWLASRLPSAALVDLTRSDAAEAVSGALDGDDGRPLVLDGADGADGLSALERVRTRPPGEGRPVLVVSRRPLLAHPEWTLSGAHAIRVPPWQDTRIRQLTADAQLDDARGRDLAVRLAGGNPLIAAAVCRAVHAGTSPDTPGAVADQVVREILRRLSRERPAREWQHALGKLATVWSGDAELLRTDPELFDTLAGLSPVTATELGLALVEPFRAVIELAHRWRQPTGHRGTRTRALVHRRRQLAEEPAAERRSRLAEGIMALSDDTAVREILFPASPSTGTVSTARAEDADVIGALMHRWALEGGLDARRTERMVEQWLCEDPAGFSLIRDGDGRAVGVMNALHVADRTMNSVESLLQQHTDELLNRPQYTGGLLVGAAYCPDRGMFALLLRHMLHELLALGRPVMVSTPNPGYQRFVHGLRFQRHGATTDDIYRCGRNPRIYSQDFSAAAVPGWLERLATVRHGDQPAGPTGQDVAHALSHIGDADRLAESPLLASPHLQTVADLQEWLRTAVAELADSGVQEDAEAGDILLRYHLGRPRTHQQLIQQLYVSRATYFRRYRHGLDALRRRLSEG